MLLPAISMDTTSPSSAISRSTDTYSLVSTALSILWRLLYCPLRTPDQKSIAIRLDSSSLSSVTFVSITRYTLWHRFSTLGL